MFFPSVWESFPRTRGIVRKSTQKITQSQLFLRQGLVFYRKSGEIRCPEGPDKRFSGEPHFVLEKPVHLLRISSRQPADIPEPEVRVEMYVVFQQQVREPRICLRQCLVFHVFSFLQNCLFRLANARKSCSGTGIIRKNFTILSQIPLFYCSNDVFFYAMLRKNGFSSVLTLFIFVADQINNTMISDKKIKKHINRKRLSMGLTQSEMAARLKIDRNTYRNIEKGKTRMVNEHLNDIASILEAETDELILGYLPGDPETDPILREKTLEYDNKTASMAASYSRKIEEDRITIQLLNKKIEDLQESLRDKTDLISFQKEKIAEYEKLLGKM